jgi:glycosyltransferase involved in cell wall biosynthesis
MRIGLLLNLVPKKLGSLEDWIVAFTRLAAHQGHDVTVFTWSPMHPLLAAHLTEQGAACADLKILERSPLRGVARLRQFDVLHLRLFAPRAPIPLMAYAAWPARVAFVDAFSASPEDDEALAERGGFKRLVDRITLARMSRLIAVSDYVLQRDLMRFGRADGKMVRIYNGVNLGRYADQPAPLHDGVRVTFMASLITEKGADVLLRAGAQVRGRFSITIAGEGPQEAALKRLAEELGLAEKVTFLGLVSDAERVLRETDIFVHPCRWAEAFGFGVAEAMAAGNAVVASRIGAIPEIVEDGYSGKLFRPGDDAELAKILDELISQPDLRKTLAEHARIQAIERFSLSDCVEAHLRLCESLQ